jgi:hypothetical protein
VVRDVSSPPGFVHPNPPVGKSLAGKQDVGLSAAAAERDDRVVLEQQDRIAQLAPNPCVEETLLKDVGLAVRNSTEPMSNEGARAHFRWAWRQDDRK